MSTHRVTCHCGAVELHITLPGGIENARHCDCSFCARRAAATVSVALDALTVTKGEDGLTLYQFGTRTAQHYFCKTCGIYTHHRRRTKAEYGVNLGCIEGENPRNHEPLPWSEGSKLPL